MGSSTDEFVKHFEKLSAMQGRYETWDAMVSTFAAAIASASMNSCQWLVDRAQAAMKNTNVTAEQMDELHALIVDSLENEPDQDMLGDAYMRLEIGNKAIGQFFTPYNIARMMAEVNTDIEKVKHHIDEHGYLSVNEPAAGGGANLIALANHLKREGVNYQRSVLFVAQELSELTALSCYVQMSLLGMPGIVLIGDTLRMDFRFELWTPMLALDETWLYRMMFERLFK